MVSSSSPDVVQLCHVHVTASVPVIKSVAIEFLGSAAVSQVSEVYILEF